MFQGMLMWLPPWVVLLAAAVPQLQLTRLAQTLWEPTCGTWGSYSGPTPVEPPPVPGPASLIVPSRFQSSDESSPGKGSKDTATAKGSKKTSKKTKKTKKSKKDDEDDASDEHQPLPGGQDDEDDMDDLDGMDELLNLQGEDDEKPKKRESKKRPASAKKAPKKRPAKKCDELDEDNRPQKAGAFFLGVQELGIC